MQDPGKGIFLSGVLFSVQDNGYSRVARWQVGAKEAERMSIGHKLHYFRLLRPYQTNSAAKGLVSSF